MNQINYVNVQSDLENVVIQNFTPLSLRNDVGALWENFLISERVKKHAYQRQTVFQAFWRNYHGQEVDYIENVNGKLHAFEFKWNEKRKSKIPAGFLKNYPESTFATYNRANFDDFVF